MARIKRGVVANRRHKKVLKEAKGYYGARSRVFRVAKQAVIKAGQYAFRDRRATTFGRRYMKKDSVCIVHISERGPAPNASGPDRGSKFRCIAVANRL
jgi:ribosomal protein L20